MVRRRAPQKPQRAPASPKSAWSLSDDAVERALLSGSHASELDELLGEAPHDELAGLARQAASRKRRGGPKVLILPGIMGSKLGTKTPILGFEYDQVFWLDPLRFALGVAKKLMLDDAGAAGTVVPLGVFLSSYLKIKFRLIIAGYDAEFYPYDWRVNIHKTGEQLKNYIDSLDEKVSLVAHSMGGLVARAAIQSKAKAERLVMLGTPNYGSFAPIQAMRGVYSIVKKLAALDLSANPSQLAEIFATFDGLCQMLPAPAKVASFDFFDLGGWPKTGPKLRPKVFLRAADLQDSLAPADNRFFLIAGYNQETVVGARLTDDKSEFEYQLSQEGDGTVPLVMARLENTKTYYVEESHGSLPNNGAVIQAVCDILSQGQTTALTDKPAIVRSASVRYVRESQIRATAAFEGQKRGQLRAAQLRDVICETAAPLPSSTPVAGAPQAERAAIALEPTEEIWQSLTVSRPRQQRLEIRLALGSITDIDARAYILGLFRAVTPTGPARAIDQLLNGVITEFTQRRMFNSNVGEVFIVPAARSALRADMVLFAGLGDYDQFNDDVQQIVAENVLRTLLRTHVEDLATVLFGAGSGADVSRVLQNLLKGFISAKLDVDDDQYFRRITLCELNPDRYRELRNEMYRLAGTELFKNIEVSFTELRPVPVSTPVYATAAEIDRRTAPPTKDPLYLLVRLEKADSKSLAIRSSLLPTGSKAAILTDLTMVDTAKLQSILTQIESNSFTFAKLPAFGVQWTEMVLPESIRTVLPNYKDEHLVVVHDAESSRLPWETLRFEKAAFSPALGAGVSHRYLADNMSVVKFLESRRQDETLRLLLIIDPTETLDGALKERDRMLSLFRKYSGVQIDKIEGSKGTRPAILKAISSGKYDVLHYAGHASFDPDVRSRSGILCTNDEVLSGADLSRLANLPNLVFFNACESARVRTARVGRGKGKKLDIATQKQAGVGFAEAFLRGGVANFVGTYWPVGDDAASIFGSTFYESILSGKMLGDAVLAGRKNLQDDKQLDWANYIHFGNYQFRVKVHES